MVSAFFKEVVPLHTPTQASKNKNDAGLGDNLAADAGDLCSKNNVGFFCLFFDI